MVALRNHTHSTSVYAAFAYGSRVTNRFNGNASCKATHYSAGSSGDWVSCKPRYIADQVVEIYEFAEREMPEDAGCTHPSCRVCFCGPDPALKAGGQLVSPCSCTGSVRFIHLHCLRTWQATQRAQGRNNRSQCCELCGCMYSLPKKVLQQEKEQFTYLETLQLGLRRIWLWFNDTAQGPVWQEALRYWRNALLVNSNIPFCCETCCGMAYD